MIGLAKTTNKILMTTAAIKIKAIAVLKIRFASSGFFSPFLLATNADIATFNAKKSDNPINLGCVVSPPAATA